MSISPDTFDPLAVVVDWLDACRSGELALLNLYHERATSGPDRLRGPLPEY